MNAKLLGIFALITVFIFDPLHGMEDAIELFSKGQYVSVINKIENNINLNNSFEGKYLLGLTYAKLQEFDKSSQNFSKSLELNPKIDSIHPDIYYQLAQGLYAQSDLNTSIEYFKKSIQIKYKSAISKYYIAVCYQKLEEFHSSIQYFKKIKKSNHELYQGAQYQIGKIVLEEIEKSAHIKHNVKKYALPALYKSYFLDTQSSVASEILTFIKEVENKYGLNPNRMINGKVLPEKRYTIRWINSYLYDTNVVNEAENATQRASKKASGIGKSDLTLRYTYPLLQRFIFQGELKGTFTHHLVQNVSQVFRNDNYVLQPKGLMGLEYTFLGKVARFELETNYYYQARDVNQIHRLEFFGQSMEYILGNRMEYFSIGESYIKLGRKEFTGRTTSVYSYTNTFGLTQSFKLPNSQMLLLLINCDFLTTYLNLTNSTRTYLTRLDYIVPNLFWSFRGGSALSVSLFDPMALRPGRGLEKNVSPSLELGRNISTFGEINLKYAYTKNFSLNKTTFQYNKHLATLEFILRF